MANSKQSIQSLQESLLDQSAIKESPCAGDIIKTYLCKMKGGKCTNTVQINWPGVLLTALGSFAGIGLVAFLAFIYNLPLLLPSLGASAALLYAACHVPMAQPRNVVGGHLISALVGVGTYQLLGMEWWTLSLGVTLAIVAMVVTQTLHPPGGATAFLAVYTGQGIDFVFSPVGTGVIWLVIIALLVNNLSSRRKYPEYWF